MTVPVTATGFVIEDTATLGMFIIETGNPLDEVTLVPPSAVPP